MNTVTDISEKFRFATHEVSTEDNILIGMITSDVFLKEAVTICKPQLFERQYSRIISEWCIEYHEKYDTAPHGDIQHEFEKWRQQIQDEDFVKLSEIFMRNLSRQSTDIPEYNEKYWLNEARRYFKKRRQEVLSDQISNAISKNRAEDVDKMLENYLKQSSSDNNLVAHLSDIAITSTDFLQKDIKPPARIIKPFLTRGSLTMIYGEAGIGKTYLIDALALGVTRENYADLSIGPWEFRRPCGVLLIDGEMAEGEIHERLKRLAGPLGEECKEHPLQIISANALGKQHQKQMNIADRKWREAITEYLRNNPQFEILILDNIASLTPGIDENVKSEWDPINQWLLSLRHMDVSVILVHHANKAHAQRGTSGRSDNLDTVIKLSKPADYDATYDGAYFKVEIEKGRNMKSGEKAPFTVRIREHEENMNWQVWCAGSVAAARGDKKRTIEALLLDGKWSQAEIVRKTGVSRSYVSETKTDLRNRKLIDSSSKVTERGRKYLSTLSIDMDDLYE